MITSTLSMSLYPKDNREIKNHCQVLLDGEGITEYLNEKALFQSTAKETQYEFGSTKEKEKEFKETYMKSFIHRSKFNMNSLVKFKDKVEMLNRNGK